MKTTPEPTNPAEADSRAITQIDQVMPRLPELVAQMLAAQADRINIRPTAEGGVEIDLVQRNRLYVSRNELADMMPRFSQTSDPRRFVDALVELGLPYSDPTGSKIFNVSKCVDWIERHFAHGGKLPQSKTKP